MDIDQQIQILIDQSPQDGKTPLAVQAIAPILKQLAQTLQHPEYYILQTMENNWAATTLHSRQQPDQEKTVVYAFPTLQDATNAPNVIQDPQLVALAVPVSHILFQMIALKSVDSTVFFEKSGDYTTGTEINCQDLRHLVQNYLKQVRTNAQVPPDIA